MYINYNYNYMNKEHEILYFYRFLMRFPYRRSCYAFSLSLPPRSKAANSINVQSIKKGTNLR